jgi:hypothetical protein
LNGHRLKNFSASKLDEKHIHLAETIDLTTEKDFRYAKFKFPSLDIPSLRLATETSPLLTLENCVDYLSAKRKKCFRKSHITINFEKSCWNNWKKWKG